MLLICILFHISRVFTHLNAVHSLHLQTCESPMYKEVFTHVTTFNFIKILICFEDEEHTEKEKEDKHEEL